VALSGGFENALGEIGFGRWCRTFQRYSGHDIFERVPHETDELRVKIRHGLAPDVGKEWATWSAAPVRGGWLDEAYQPSSVQRSEPIRNPRHPKRNVAAPLRRSSR
jgi:hypothetical protein